jgi:hypothetical protein
MAPHPSGVSSTITHLTKPECRLILSFDEGSSALLTAENAAELVVFCAIHSPSSLAQTQVKNIRTQNYPDGCDLVAKYPN